MNDERFFDLAMKVIARQCTDAERAELDALLACEPERSAEFARLQAEVRIAKETMPLVNATEATAGEFPAYARGRLQTKVQQTLGRPTTEKESRNKLVSVLLPSLAPGLPVKEEMATEKHKKMFLRWYWWFGLAATTAVVVLVALPMFRAPNAPAIQLAMLDTAGSTRGGDTNDVLLLRETWTNATLDSFANAESLQTWSTNWSNNPNAVKIIYDRAAAEVRVLGRWNGISFDKTFLIDQDLQTTLRRAKDFVSEQMRR